MKTPSAKTSTVPRLLLCGAAALLLGMPPLRAQTAADFDQLKAMIQQLQKTVDTQNARIAELEKNHPTASAEAIAVEKASPSQKTISEVASGRTVGQASQVTKRDAMNDQQEAASRPKDYTLDPTYKGFIPVPNTAVLIKINAKPNYPSADPEYRPPPPPASPIKPMGGGNTVPNGKDD